MRRCAVLFRRNRSQPRIQLLQQLHIQCRQELVERGVFAQATTQGGSAGKRSQGALEGAGVLVKHLDGVVFNLGGVHCISWVGWEGSRVTRWCDTLRRMQTALCGPPQISKP